MLLVFDLISKKNVENKLVKFNLKFASKTIIFQGDDIGKIITIIEKYIHLFLLLFDEILKL